MANVRNLDYIHTQDPKLYETLTDIIQAHDNTSLQANLNGGGWPAPPPSIHGLEVTANNGHFQIGITDHNPLFRDVHYYVEHADNPNFTDPHVVHMGHSRNLSLFLGNSTRYFRAYSSYPTSPPGDPVYHGGTTPRAVAGGGAIPGPAFLKSQSSGTGTPGQGLTGPGILAFRGQAGRIPNRRILKPTAALIQPAGGAGYTVPPAPAGAAAGGLAVVGFDISDATAGTNIGPMLVAPGAGTVSKCVVIVKLSDSATGLTFQIRQNGQSVFSSAPAIAAGTVSGTLFNFTLTSVPLNLAAGDVFTIDSVNGSNNWAFTAQLES